jgi:hypothetical protein
MPAFINSHPWNLMVGLGGFAVVLVAFAAATSWWLLVAPFALVVAVNIWRQTFRAYALVTRGFHSQQISKGRLRYEEMHGSRRRSLTLDLEYTEPGHQELFIPSETKWINSVPAWAQQRRNEIARRISETWKSGDVHLNN